MSLFEVVQKESGQRVAVATTDILPGTLLFTDSPLLIAKDFPPKDLEFDTKQGKTSFLSFAKGVLGLPLDKKEKFFGIYAHEQPLVPPLVSTLVGINRELLVHADLLYDAISIFMANYVMVDAPGHRISAVYEKWSFVQHSCGGNCVRAFSDPTGTAVSYCRALRHIKAGETLTSSCIPGEAMLPTHKRRKSLLLARGFTCHCHRCDAEGDDTRKFPCSAQPCSGSHHVCHPMSPIRATIPNTFYEGVTYVEPHLLPCTICKATPPPSYQQQMFDYEQQMLDRTDNIVGQLHRCKSGADLLMPYMEVQRLPIIRDHGLLMDRTCQLRNHIFRAYARFNAAGEFPDMFAYPQADAEAAELIESILGGASMNVVDAWCTAAVMLLHRTDEPQLAKRIVQKYLRVYYIIFGRETRRTEIEQDLLGFIKVQPVPQDVVDMTVCAFCEESPQRAALTLSKCGRCMKVAYCSKGCQKAHWKLHKQQCGKA